MKIGLVYTGVTPELIELVEREIRKQLGSNIELLSYKILNNIRSCGK